jgi:hypothetical protein
MSALPDERVRPEITRRFDGGAARDDRAARHPNARSHLAAANFDSVASARKHVFGERLRMLLGHDVGDPSLGVDEVHFVELATRMPDGDRFRRVADFDVVSTHACERDPLAQVDVGHPAMSQHDHELSAETRALRQLQAIERLRRWNPRDGETDVERIVAK